MGSDPISLFVVVVIVIIVVVIDARVAHLAAALATGHGYDSDGEDMPCARASVTYAIPSSYKG